MRLAPTVNHRGIVSIRLPKRSPSRGHTKMIQLTCFEAHVKGFLEYSYSLRICKTPEFGSDRHSSLGMSDTVWTYYGTINSKHQVKTPGQNTGLIFFCPGFFLFSLFSFADIAHHADQTNTLTLFIIEGSDTMLRWKDDVSLSFHLKIV